MKTNYHTHTIFCDGKNSAEEMVLSAIEKNIDILGFSAHTMYPFASTWHIPCQNYSAYTAEIERLKKKYRDSITILTGFEADFVYPLSTPDKARYAPFGADYLISSVHYSSGGAFSIDANVQEVTDGLVRYYNGNGKQLVLDYYKAVREMILSCDFDIIGHIDVIRKRNGILKFFDEQADWYKNEIEQTAEAAGKRNVIAEINTGGIARGAMDDLYPSADFLAMLNANKVPIMINSDAHTTSGIDHSFDRAAESAKKAGYTQTVYLRDGKRFFSPL